MSGTTHLLALIAALLPWATLAEADSLWNHNGSIMRLQHEGQRRLMTYEQPRQGMRNAGVTSGTLFFEGVRTGDEYQGMARVFSARCPAPMTFPISGRVVGETRIVLEGMRPVFSDCAPTGEMKLDRLEFDFIGEAEPLSRMADAGDITAPDAPLDMDPKLIDPDRNYAWGTTALAEGRIEEGLGYLREASRYGHVQASLDLGRFYSNGQYVAHSRSDALYYLERAAQAGDPEAQFLLARAVESQFEVSPSAIREARQWYHRAAEARHAEAAYNVGIMFEFGIGGELDLTEAVRFYRIASDAGLTEAEERSSNLVSRQTAIEENILEDNQYVSEQNFHCVADICDATESIPPIIIEVCNQMVELVALNEYDVRSVKSCIFKDFPKNSYWVTLSGGDFSSMSIYPNGLDAVISLHNLDIETLRTTGVCLIYDHENGGHLEIKDVEELNIDHCS